MKKFFTVLVVLCSIVLMAGAIPTISHASQAQAKQAVEQPAMININTADAAQLETLPGIGPKIAEEIIHYRQTGGPFKSIEDIKQVKGMGDKKFNTIKDKITVD